MELNEKTNQYDILAVELSESKDRVFSLLKELEETNEALSLATGKINSLEDNHINLERKLMKYSGTLKVLSRNRKNNPVPPESSNTEKVKDMRKKLS